jgi:hypothetical protein
VLFKETAMQVDKVKTKSGGVRQIVIPDPVIVGDLGTYRIVLRMSRMRSDDANAWKEEWKPQTEYSIIVEQTNTSDAMGQPRWERHEATDHPFLMQAIVRALLPKWPECF